MADITFGVHTGPSNTTVGELVALWSHVEQGPFDWISIWDHLYGADGTSPHNLEAVAMHTALAMSTSRVTCGSLVYCAGYRHPAVLANAMATIDHLSGGRCAFGIGAGWAHYEYDAYGFHFARSRGRLDLMEESLRCIAGLLRQGEDERFDFEGEHFTMHDAACVPAPVQERLPIWVGGGGERRTLPMAARHADGWNVPFISPEQFRHKNELLDELCEAEGRDPASLARAVNVGHASDDASLETQFGALAEVLAPGVLMGTTAELTEGIGRFVEAGATQINLALRAPFAYEAVDAVAASIESFASG
jgi:alkanesulfonate monooxygenase SsuD/methylene tetrahydromethanopterin reductase-like flavin-dependent oxidoreductase (luciferase family)